MGVSSMKSLGEKSLEVVGRTPQDPEPCAGLSDSSQKSSEALKHLLAKIKLKIAQNEKELTSFKGFNNKSCHSE